MGAGFEYSLKGWYVLRIQGTGFDYCDGLVQIMLSRADIDFSLGVCWMLFTVLTMIIISGAAEFV